MAQVPTKRKGKEGWAISSNLKGGERNRSTQRRPRGKGERLWLSINEKKK